MRRLLFSFLIVAVVWLIGNSTALFASSIPSDCDYLGTLLYEDVGCRPIFKHGARCPTEFSCNPFDYFYLNKDECLFRGKKYLQHEQISDNFIMENCLFDCVCENPAGYNKYKCRTRYCPEWIDKYNRSICYKMFDPSLCCSIGEKCLNVGEEIFECPFEGTIYKEGELFTVNNTCTICSCRKGFTGVIEEPFCHRPMCATQLMDHEELENYCAPLYVLQPRETVLCCPNDWVCYSKNDTIGTLAPEIRGNTNIPCNFGPIKVPTGDGFKREFVYYGQDINVTCTCVMPPLMTCRVS